jgi:hypothetical protein
MIMGWIKDLGDFYEKEVISESVSGLRYDHPRIPRGVMAPQTAGGNLSYRNNKLGLDVPNLAADSLAGNVQFGNPHEQEESVCSKGMVIKEIDNLLSDLDESSPTDRVAIMVLGKLKERIS